MRKPVRFSGDGLLATACAFYRLLNTRVLAAHPEGMNAMRVRMMLQKAHAKRTSTRVRPCNTTRLPGCSREAHT